MQKILRIRSVFWFRIQSFQGFRVVWGLGFVVWPCRQTIGSCRNYSYRTVTKQQLGINFRTLTWTIPYKAIFWVHIPFHSPYIGQTAFHENRAQLPVVWSFFWRRNGVIAGFFTIVRRLAILLYGMMVYIFSFHWNCTKKNLTRKKNNLNHNLPQFQ